MSLRSGWFEEGTPFTGASSLTGHVCGDTYDLTDCAQEEGSGSREGGEGKRRTR